MVDKKLLECEAFYDKEKKTRWLLLMMMRIIVTKHRGKPLPLPLDQLVERERVTP